MSGRHNYLLRFCRAKKTYLYLLSCCMLLFICLALWSSQASALSVQEEVAIDRQAGLLDRPWKINLIRVSTREYLKRRAVVRTGFRVHDRDAHKAEQTPEAEYASITRTPTPGATVPSQPTVEPGTQPTTSPASAPSPSPAPAPSPSPAPTPSPSPSSPQKIDPGLDSTPSPGITHVYEFPSPPKLKPYISPYPHIAF